MKRLCSLLLGVAVLCFCLTGIPVSAAELVPAYLKTEDFNFDSAADFGAHTIYGSLGSGAMEAGQAYIKSPADGSSAGFLKVLDGDAGAHTEGLYRGVVQFTQVGGGYVQIKPRSSSGAAGKTGAKFTMELLSGGAMAVNSGGVQGWYRKNNQSANVNDTYRLEYEIDEDADTVSVWITNVSEGLAPVLVTDAQPILNKSALGDQNTCAVDIYVAQDTGNTNPDKGVKVDYVYFGEAEAVSILQAAEELTEQKVLAGNSGSDAVVSDLYMPESLPERRGISVAWESSVPDVIAADGRIARPVEDTPVTLTAVLTAGAKDPDDIYVIKKTFDIMVLGSESKRDIVIADFKDQAAIEAVPNLEADKDEYNLYDISARVTPSASTDRINTPQRNPGQDASNCQYINFWIHSAGAAGQKIGIVLYDTNGKLARYNNGTSNGYLIDWTDAPGDWHLVSLPRSSMVNANANTPVDWSSIRNMRITFSSSGGVLKEGAVLHFDRIWLSVESPSEADFVRRARWIGNEQFDYQDVEALREGEGIEVTDSRGGIALGSVSAADGQAVLMPGRTEPDPSLPDEEDAYAVTLKKQWRGVPEPYTLGKFMGEFQFTQISGGRSFFQIQSQDGTADKLRLEQERDGTLILYSGAEPIAFRSGAENLNQTFRVAYALDEDTNTGSVWITCVTDSTERVLVAEDVPFLEQAANDKDGAAVLFGAEPDFSGAQTGGGVMIDYTVFARPADFTVLQELAHITLEQILAGNTSASFVTDDLALPQESIYGGILMWTSTNPDVISETGRVVTAEEPAEATLTVIVTADGKEEASVFPFTVVDHVPTARELINEAIASFGYSDLISADQDASKLTGDLKPLPDEIKGIPVMWKSSDPAHLSHTGKVTQSENGEAEVTLTGTLTLDGVTGTVEFPFIIAQKTKIIYERTFLTDDVSDVKFTVSDGFLGEQKVENGKYTITKLDGISDNPLSYETVIAEIPFNTYDVPYDDSARTAVYRNAYSGIYEVEVVFSASVKTEFAAIKLMGASGNDQTFNTATILVKPNIIQTYINGYYDLLSGGTGGRTYRFKYRVNTDEGRFWMYINDAPVGYETGYTLASNTQTINSMAFSLKEKGSKGDTISVERITLTEIESTGASNQEGAVNAALGAVSMADLTDNPAQVTENLKPLPSSVGDVKVTWKSDRPDVMAHDGSLLKTPLGEDADVTMTGMFRAGDLIKYKSYRLTVAGDKTAAGKLKAAAAEVDFAALTSQASQAVTQSLNPLPASGKYNTSVTWKSSRPDYMTDTGKLVKRDPYQNIDVIMTAVFSLGDETLEKTFKLTIPLDEEAGLYTFIKTGFSEGISNSWTLSQQGGIISVSNGRMDIQKTEEPGAPSAALNFAEYNGTALPLSGMLEFETEVAAAERMKQGTYTIYDSSGAPAARLVFEIDRTIGSETFNRPVYYVNYSGSGAAGRGEADELQTAKTVFSEGSRIKTKIRINTANGALTVKINDNVVADGYTLRAVKDVQSAVFSAEDKEDNLGRLSVYSLSGRINRGKAIDLLMDTVAYSQGVTDGGYLTGDVILRAYELMGTESSWTSSNPEMISETGKFTMPAVPTKAELTLKVWFTDNPAVYSERVYHVTGMSVDSDNLAVGKKVTTDAEGSTANRAANAVDGKYDTAWVTLRGEEQPSLTVDMGGLCFISRAVLFEAAIREAYPIQGYMLEGSADGEKWSVLTMGAGIGENSADVSFPQAKVRFVRFRVTEKETGNCGVRELELYFDASEEQRTAAELALIELGITGAITSDIDLPALGYYGSVITYTSSDPDVLSPAGKVTRGVKNQVVVLTAHIGDQSRKLPAVTVLGTGGGTNGGTGGTGGGSGGGSSYPNNGSVSLPPAESAQPRQDRVFDDVDEGHWAFRYIKDLKVRGVISGDGVYYYPEAPVTREEFVKMLLGAFAVEPGGGEAFADVEPDAWYAAYVAKAKELGIVMGISEEQFGTGKSITREDIAVLCSRMLAYTGGTLKKVQMPAAFTDAQDISDYARPAVEAMQQAGIINGYEDGTFAPGKSVTRAETAKILFMLL